MSCPQHHHPRQRIWNGPSERLEPHALALQRRTRCRMEDSRPPAAGRTTTYLIVATTILEWYRGVSPGHSIDYESSGNFSDRLSCFSTRGSSGLGDTRQRPCSQGFERGGADLKVCRVSDDCYTCGVVEMCPSDSRTQVKWRKISRRAPE